MKSPFTGKEMKLIREKRKLFFRKEEFEFTHHAFRCDEAKKEASMLIANFVLGSWKSLSFDSDSEMSRLLIQDPAFKKYASAYEAKALEYFQANNTLEGFKGADVMATLESPLHRHYTSKSFK